MTVLTTTEVLGWIGRLAQDPYGEKVGVIEHVLRDIETGTPEWLVIGDGGGGEGALAPLEGAVQTGQQVRVVATAEQLRGAPRIRPGEELDLEAKRRAAEHYGLSLDRDASPAGALRPGEDGAARHHLVPGDAPAAPLGEKERHEIVAMLRMAHAVEQGALEDLVAMRWRDADESLVHDIALHHKATNRHAAMVRNRLGELEAGRARPLDWAVKAFAYVHAQLGRLRSNPDPADVKSAIALERHELELYTRLADIARRAGDQRTLELAERIRADEEAMLYTLRARPVWADPAKPDEEPSPFEAPQPERAIEPPT